jgi:hypothetical protein
VTQRPGGTAYTAFKGFPFGKVAVGGKTGTAQKQGHADTSWFMSFAGRPGHKPEFVTAIVVPYGGFGASVAAPAARRVWDGIYGLENHTAALPHGLDRALPRFKPDGSVATRAPAGSHAVRPKPGASPSASPSIGALPAPGGATTIDPAAYALPLAEPARRAPARPVGQTASGAGP